MTMTKVDTEINEIKRTTDPAMSVTVTVTTEVTLRRIADLMCSCIEGGYSQWCLGIYLKTPDLDGEIVEALAEEKHAASDTGIWYNIEKLYGRDDLAIEVLEDEDDCGDREKAKKHILTKASIVKGLQLFAEKYPRHWNDFITENDDAITADSWLQVTVLGDIVYG